MHELGIAKDIVERVEQVILEQKWRTASEVSLRLGSLSGVDPEALKFGFEAIVAETPLTSCRLSIELVPARAQCRACATGFEVEDLLFECPNCRSREVDSVDGMHLELVSIAGE